MKILLTNDDGIYSQGIRKLQEQLATISKVEVVAPDSERSSVGHGITLSKPIFYKKVHFNNQFFGHAITGTPADCIKLGLKIILKNKPDLIVSGINLGPNDGHSIYYSGTVAGAREGALVGIPAIAFSLGTFVNPDFDFSAKMAFEIVKSIDYKKIPQGSFLNINIPSVKKSQLKGIVVTRQDLNPIHTKFISKKNPLGEKYFWMTGNSPKTKKSLKTDTAALAQNYITITPIQIDATNSSFLSKLNKWKFPNAI